MNGAGNGIAIGAGTDSTGTIAFVTGLLLDVSVGLVAIKVVMVRLVVWVWFSATQAP